MYRNRYRTPGSIVLATLLQLSGVGPHIKMPAAQPLVVEAAAGIDVTQPSAANGFRIYNTADRTTNYERFVMKWAGNVATLKMEKGGTGTSRSVDIVSNDGSGLRIGDFALTTVLGTSGGFHTIQTGSDAAFLRFLGRITTQTTPAIDMLGSAFGTPYSASTAVRQLVARIQAVINQSGSAAYSALQIPITEATLGAGPNYFLEMLGGAAGNTLRCAFKSDGRFKNANAANEATAATAGANGDVPAQVVGYLIFEDSSGAARKIPYYAT